MAGNSKRRKTVAKPPTEGQVDAVMRLIAYAVSRQEKTPTLEMILSMFMKELAVANQSLGFIASELREIRVLTDPSQAIRHRVSAQKESTNGK